MADKGLLVYVLRHARGDRSNGGISSKATSAILVGDSIPGVFGACAETPALRLVVRWPGTPNEHMHAEPIDRPAGMFGPVFGGNFVFTSDERFPSRQPIPIHDRFESAKLAEALAR